MKTLNSNRTEWAWIIGYAVVTTLWVSTVSIMVYIAYHFIDKYW